MPEAAQVIATQMETPKSSVGVFELPCGYLDEQGNLYTQVEVREITGAEEDMLSSDKIDASQKFDELIIRCLKRIGTISDPARIRAIAPELTAGDRLFLIFSIRRVTLGDEYPFVDRCPECKLEKMYVINLNELEVYKMKEPRKRIYDITLSSKRTVRFKLVYGKDDPALAKLAKSNDASSLGILFRLELLDGKPPQLSDLKNMGLKERQELRDALTGVDGGVDTEIQMQCPNCHAEFSRDVQVGTQSFFFPSGVLKAWSRRSSI
jgi:hypothetical protein